MFKAMNRSLAPQLPQLHPPLFHEVPGDQFAGRAVEVSPNEREREVPAPAFDLLTRLANLPIQDKKLRARRDDLRGVLQAAVQEAQAFLSEAIQRRNVVLESELEEIRTQGRAQMKVVKSLESELGDKLFKFHAARSAAEAARDHLNDLRTTRVSRWTSREDRDALQQEIRKAEAALKRANTEVVTATNRHNALADDLAKAQKKMGELSNREIVLRGELSGKVFFDPETMLPVMPSV